MPTYVYACDSCGKQFEKFQSFKDEPLNVCPCGQEGKVRRVIQPAGVVFKGSGWYITDSKGSSSASSSASAPASSAAGSTDSSSKADSAASEKSVKSDSPATASSDD